MEFVVREPAGRAIVGVVIGGDGKGAWFAPMECAGRPLWNTNGLSQWSRCVQNHLEGQPPARERAEVKRRGDRIRHWRADRIKKRGGEMHVCPCRLQA